MNLPLTAPEVINALLKSRWRDDFCLPNYTPSEWWECDVFQLRPNGRWLEYEVKTTFQDFKADAEKHDRHGRRKHDLLDTSPRGPSFYYFVCPSGMISDANLPPWAGLLEYTVRSKLSRLRPFIEFSEYKPAPLRHTQPIAPAVRQHALGVCYWRYHGLRQDDPAAHAALQPFAPIPALSQ